MAEEDYDKLYNTIINLNNEDLMDVIELSLSTLHVRFIDKAIKENSKRIPERIVLDFAASDSLSDFHIEIESDKKYKASKIIQ